MSDRDAWRFNRLPVPAIVRHADAKLIELDAKIDQAEDDGVRGRWEFGRELLRERVGRKLPKGRLDQLAERTGKSREELQCRIRFAERFPDEAELRNAVTQYGSWHNIVTEALPERGKRTYGKNTAGAHEGIALSAADADGPNWKLLLGDFTKRLHEIPAGTFDAVVTDPPYSPDRIDIWDKLGEASARLLRPGGVFAARCGHLALPEVLAVLSLHLSYGWVYAEPLPGSNVRFLARRIAVAYQPWVAFSHGSWPAGQLDWHPDQLQPSPRTKTRYIWEQKVSVAAEITATFTEPGQNVLDPLAGSGTFGEAALAVGCRWVGVELDPAGHAQAADRLRKLAA